ncbi:MAG: YfiR family protein [Verrucomicrobiota bacterium]
MMLVLIISAMLSSTVIAQSAPEIKGAFIYSFSKLVKWPDHVYTSQNASLTIGFIGETNVQAYLTAATSGRLVNAQKIEVRRIDISDIDKCQIIFIADSSRIEEVIRQCDGKPILTMSDVKGFAARGGAVEYVEVNGKVRFHINWKAANQGGLISNAKLKTLARRVINQ